MRLKDSTLNRFMRGHLAAEMVDSFMEIENPFENSVHDTPMSSLSRMIEINVRQNMGGTNLPADIRPVDGFVY